MRWSETNPTVPAQNNQYPSLSWARKPIKGEPSQSYGWDSPKHKCGCWRYEHTCINPSTFHRLQGFVNLFLRQQAALFLGAGPEAWCLQHLQRVNGEWNSRSPWNAGCICPCLWSLMGKRDQKRLYMPLCSRLLCLYFKMADSTRFHF